MLLQTVGFGKKATGGGGGSGVSLVKTTHDTDAGTSNSFTTTHNLDGSGSNRLVVAIITCHRNTSRSINSITLNSVSGNLIYHDTKAAGADGERAFIGAAYWPDSDHPGAGNFDIVTTFNNGVPDYIARVVELEGVDQTGLIAHENTNDTNDVTPNSLSLGVSMTGHQGKAGLVMISGGEGSANIDGTTDLTSDNVDNELGEVIFNGSIQTVWLDTDVSSDPLTYTITGSGSTLAVDAWHAISAVITPA